MPYLPILTLALAAFAIGTTEFAVQGLLPEISKALGVSISVKAIPACAGIAQFDAAQISDITR